MNQLAIALFGLTSMWMALGNSAPLRKWAPVLGLLGQPFWFMATVPTQQWGMVALCVAYTAVYLHAIWMHWGAK